ncbi:hypothetical protein AB0912_13755 [Streptomyces sp. NPDC007084]|uniref:hypothetical protein n=1 Tax=Streptomyces sp. NPDC007084 TaxID=3154313 RepID=UPI003451E910
MSETEKPKTEPDNTHVTGGEDGEEITPLNTHVTSSPIKPVGTTGDETKPDNTHVTGNPA